jgi:hypothetical protein
MCLGHVFGGGVGDEKIPNAKTKLSETLKN